MFADRSEATMTMLVDTVVQEVIDPEEWAKCSMIQQQQVKSQLLPIITAAVDAVDAEPYKAKRGDEVERWLRWHRDSLPSTKVDEDWLAVDALLDDYRLHADTGTPLTSDADEMGG